ncbi:hypothetical protein DPMN_152345 [Dreissena polymorpha]|uniref:Uncharacterized protein n=1 Tax=Dreissena polymorpha TaxID=45954 RepID=A0A9D4J891_DREPO|nr:hypothetical protein DPMN_152345 [Dreissena polymorpha]
MIYTKYYFYFVLFSDSARVTSLEFPVWIVQISTNPSQCTTLPSIEYILLENVKCSYTLLCSLLSSLLTLDHQVEFELINCDVGKLFNTRNVKIKTENKKIAVSVLDCFLWEDITMLTFDENFKAFRKNQKKELLSQIVVLRSQLDKLSIVVYDDHPDQWKNLHGLNINSLSLRMYEVNHAESLSQSLASLTQLEMLSIKVNCGNRALWEALHGLGIKSLCLSGNWNMWYGLKGLRVKNAKSLKQSILSLKQLETLNVSVCEDTPGLWEALQGLSIKSLSLSCTDLDFELKYATSLKQSLVSLKQLDTLSVSMHEDNPGMWEALQGLSIKSLSLNRFKLKYATSLKKSILSLKQLETLNVSVYEEAPGLWEALQGLSIKILNLTLSKALYDEYLGFRLKYATSLKQSILPLKELETLSISVNYDSPGLWEALHSLSIKSLRLRGIDRGFINTDF